MVYKQLEASENKIKDACITGFQFACDVHAAVRGFLGAMINGFFDRSNGKLTPTFSLGVFLLTA